MIDSNEAALDDNFISLNQRQSALSERSPCCIRSRTWALVDHDTVAVRRRFSKSGCLARPLSRVGVCRHSPSIKLRPICLRGTASAPE
jgi:hypothetical protein